MFTSIEIIKDYCLQTFQTMKLKIINKSKNGENVPSLEVDEINE